MMTLSTSDISRGLGELEECSGDPTLHISVTVRGDEKLEISKNNRRRPV